MSASSDFKVMAFSSAKGWDRWLADCHGETSGVWLRFYKKDSAAVSVSYDEALAVALCYGWIDGQLKKYNDGSWLRKFTPRRVKSIWSKRNCDLSEQLVKSKKMKSAGLKEISAAKADGRWDRAYDSPSKMTVPEDFVKHLSRNKKALLFFKTLNKANTYAITWRLQTAKKPETRDKRIKTIIDMLANGKAIHD